MDTSLIISAQGFFLTLIGLLSAFFYVHLSNWYGQLVSLKSKWDLNESGETKDEKQALLECRYALAGVYNWVPAAISAVITLFILMLTLLSVLLWSEYNGPSNYRLYLMLAGGVFLVTYLILSGLLLFKGYSVGRSVAEAIANKYPSPNA